MRLHIVNNYWRTTAKLNLFVKHNYITWHPVFNYITYKTYLKTKCPCKGLLKKNKTYHGNNKWYYCVFSKNKN